MEISAECSDRGWSMKHGHRKRLTRSGQSGGNGNADEPLALLCGRSTMKRSVNNGSRREFGCPTLIGTYGPDHKIHTRRTKLRQHMMADLLELKWAEEQEWYWSNGWEEDELDVCSLSDSDETLSLVSFGSESTAASTRDQQKAATKQKKNFAANYSEKVNRWDEAVSRAKMLAQKYQTAAKVIAKTSTEDSKVPNKVKQLVDNLKKKGVSVSPHELGNSTGSFESFRLEFLEQFFGPVCSGLRTIFRNDIVLRPTPTSKAVQDQFLHAKAEKKGNVSAVFHGTDEKNLPSIYQKGLLVPGGEKGVHILNGASHGNGIYTSKTHNAALSFGFCRGPKRPMLICGVLDSAVPLAQPYVLGRHYVTADSKQTRHVGDAIVVFDESCIIPLFEASDPLISPSYVPPAAPAITRSTVAVAAPTTACITPAIQKPYNGGPKTRARPKKETKSEKVVTFLTRRAARIRFEG
mmetsp:Transcript_58998/g.110531  ORF Transcript_58998/g.110531 Transcript_58998/m.110531 type:complete len:465 (+) Transcript_58998:60-1454(+)